jgi:(p)ppGpp synthase/HD superfamily hydrolase
VKVYQALLIAEHAHRGQLRKYSSDPYLLHPIRVAHMMAYAGYDEDVQAAALLHDVAEDTAVTLQHLADDARVSTRTYVLVHALTKWWGDHVQNEAERAEYYGRILLDPDAIALKVADRVDNVHDMTALWHRTDVRSTRRWIRRYIDKTEREFAPLVARLADHGDEPSGILRDYYTVALEAARVTLTAGDICND